MRAAYAGLSESRKLVVRFVLTGMLNTTAGYIIFIIFVLGRSDELLPVGIPARWRV